MFLNDDIRVEYVNNCLLCDREGVLLYKDLRDRILEVKGVWNFYKCPRCCFIWLNPRPLSEDIWKLYVDYRSHVYGEADLKPSFRSKLKIFFLNISFDYNKTDKKQLKIINIILKKLIKTLPYVGKFSDRLVMFLPYEKRGNLFDVGCGSGNLISIMHNLGWDVTGVEPDEKAVKIIKEKIGIDIYKGYFEEINLPEKFFDAVTMRHFIEHVQDPIFCINKALKILKPGGKLVLITPNLESLTHNIFKQNYYHLDPPRHMQLFSKKSLLHCAQKAGVEEAMTWTIPAAADMVYFASKKIQKYGKNNQRQSVSIDKLIISISYWILELFLTSFWSNTGEEVVLEYIKHE